jgi:tetratricopeptide (TPR) repeat protein
MSDRAQDRPGSGPKEDTLSGSEIEITADLEESQAGPRSIDNLLALTDDGWDIDKQVKTLQTAAGGQPALRPEALRAPKVPSIAVPTPFDLGLRASSPALAPTVVADAPPPSVSPPGGTPSRPPPVPSKPPVPRISGPPSARRGPPPLPSSSPQRTSEPSPVRARVSIEPAAPASLIELLHARVATLSGPSGPGGAVDDKVALARAHLELAVAHETNGDEGKSLQHAEAALVVDKAFAAAHGMLRRKRHERGAIGQMLAHLEYELESATSEAATVELLAEKARLVEALGDRVDTARAAWEAALTRAPNHAAALKGLEAELFARAMDVGGAATGGSGGGDRAPLGMSEGYSAARRGEAWDALAVHLARMSDAYASAAKLAAWLHVERGHILERRLGRVDASRGAFERALQLDPSVGPVRAAFVRHVAANGDAAGLCSALAEEAQIEKDPARSARLELDAACIAHLQLRDDARAILLLERAASRAPTVAAVDRRVLDELVTLHESAGESLEEARARRARLPFVTEPAALAFELRALALVEEKIGNRDVAIADVQRALAVDATDTTLVELLDRLLESANKPEARVALWLTEGARAEEGPRRAKALAKAAHIAEHVLGKPEDAVKHLRAAWIASPGDSEVLDHLSRLLAPSPSESLDSEVRGLAELYASAAQKTNDVIRRIAYLEKNALLWEDLLGDTKRAARAFEDILAIAPDHRGALLGLARTAARIGDDRALARALLDEAKHAHDGVDVLALKVRAATALARLDPTRALLLTAEVIEAEPAHAGARALETRLHEDATRWEMAAKSYRARIDYANKPSDKVALWLALAQLQETRLRTPYDAIESLKAARAVDPAHPVPDVEIARVLSATGNDRALKSAYRDLAKTARTPEERARFLVRAAELDEMRLFDDVSAAEAYAQALDETPDDELIAERLARVLARRAAAVPSKVEEGAPRPAQEGLGALVEHVMARMDRATSPDAQRALSFDLAWLLTEVGSELPRATALLEGIVEAQPDHAPALRLLESIARRHQAWAPLSRVLSRQGETLVDVRARLGALWELASLEEWRLPVSDAQSTYARILDLDPTDPGALEALVRRELTNARRGDPRSRRQVVSALASLCAIAPDDGTRLALELRLAMLLESIAAEASDASGPQIARDALARYGAALEVDPLSVTAATGLARMSTRLADAFGAVAAATSLADLATNPKMRARYLFDAAELLLGPDDDARLGPRPDRRARAATLLEKALDSDADAVNAALRLASLRLESNEGERLIASFQLAMARATTAEAIVMLGTEIARVARDELGDLVVAIEAMRKVRTAAPTHVPSLLTLAELCIAQRSWPEAVEALEAVVAKSVEPVPRMTALFALASVYEKVLARPADAERALRHALSIEPSNPRALRALLHKLASSRATPGGSGGSDRAPPGVGAKPTAGQREEVADLLDRLANAERDPGSKCDILLELADMRMQLGDPHGAERALVDAVAHAPQNARAFARLGAHFRTPQGRDAIGYARALHGVIHRGTQLGHVDARWLATLGQLEVEALGKTRDGIQHLARATQMDPTLYETRFELAAAYAKVGANDEASRTLLAMMSPSSRPLAGLSDPGAGLALLERSLGAERRSEEALVVSELRALAGDLDDGRHAWLRARRLPPHESHHGQLDRPTLVTHVLPPEGRHVLLEVAAAVAGIESKVLRADASELGLHSRDRVSSRSGHPTKALLDRLMKTLGLDGVELVIAQTVSRVRVIAQDALWVVVPKELTERHEPSQVAALGRVLARIALGVPWIEELPPPHVEAFLVAAARQVVPSFGDDFVDVIQKKLVAQYEPGVAKALTRRHKKMLEELAPHVAAPQGRPLPMDAFVNALARAELRASYLLGGDLLATIDELRALDAIFARATDRAGPQAVSAVLDHPFAGDVARFALTGEATALRRRIGTTWTG